jgi:2-keto-3-deoxy-L-rhamnonate aldolase RhmA
MMTPTDTDKAEPFEVILFSQDPEYASAALAAGCDAVVVDWEWHGKERRQLGFDTEINRGGPDSLSRMRAATPGRLICRINNLASRRRDDLAMAMDLGADEVWLPMIRDVAEVEECLEVLDGRLPLGVQVETREGLRIGTDLQRFPLSRVFIGLNDLWVDRKRHGHLFTPLVDGSLDTFRATCSGLLGVAGVTAPDRGAPVPQLLLLAAMARLGCGFGVARRSFRRDVPIRCIASVLSRIRETYTALRRRSIQQITTDQEALARCVRELEVEDIMP